MFFIESTLKVDDPVGAIAVHGVNGAWGVLSLGLFADGSYGDGWNGVPGTVKGLFYGDASQFAAQCVGTLTCIVWVFVCFFVFFKILDAVLGNRVSARSSSKVWTWRRWARLAIPTSSSRKGRRPEATNDNGKMQHVAGPQGSAPLPARRPA